MVRLMLHNAAIATHGTWRMKMKNIIKSTKAAAASKAKSKATKRRTFTDTDVKFIRSAAAKKMTLAAIGAKLNSKSLPYIHAIRAKTARV